MTSATLYLVRHASAGDRGDWSGADRDRPLDARGLEQAEAIARTLEAERPTRLLSSPYRRCVQTLEPLAELAGMPVETTRDLAEGAGPEPLLKRMGELAGAVCCTHGDVLLELLSWLVREGVVRGPGLRAQKGSTWRITVEAGRPIRAEYTPPPA